MTTRTGWDKLARIRRSFPTYTHVLERATIDAAHQRAASGVGHAADLPSATARRANGGKHA